MAQTRPHSGVNCKQGFSPDGTKVAFISLRGGGQEVYVMVADGSNQVNVTENPGGDILPSWSPDGSQIAFVSNLEG